MGDFIEAERLYERAIKAWSALGAEHPYVAKGLDGLAQVFERRGAFTGARTLFERALAIRRKIRSDHPDVAWTLTNIARVAAASGDLPLALRHLTEATAIYRTSGTSSEPDHLARTITQRGDIRARRRESTSWPVRTSWKHSTFVNTYMARITPSPRSHVYGSQPPTSRSESYKRRRVVFGEAGPTKRA